MNWKKTPAVIIVFLALFFSSRAIAGVIENSWYFPGEIAEIKKVYPNTQRSLEYLFSGYSCRFTEEAPSWEDYQRLIGDEYLIHAVADLEQQIIWLIEKHPSFSKHYRFPEVETKIIVGEASDDTFESPWCSVKKPLQETNCLAPNKYRDDFRQIDRAHLALYLTYLIRELPLLRQELKLRQIRPGDDITKKIHELEDDDPIYRRLEIMKLKAIDLDEQERIIADLREQGIISEVEIENLYSAINEYRWWRDANRAEDYDFIGEFLGIVLETDRQIREGILHPDVRDKILWNFFHITIHGSVCETHKWWYGGGPLQWLIAHSTGFDNYDFLLERGDIPLERYEQKKEELRRASYLEAHRFDRRY